jgi:hypothetical protein
MIKQVIGWDLDRYKLLIQILGVITIGILIVYVILSSKNRKD